VDEEDPILLFDGVCNFCTGTVRFIIRRDKHRTFRFASLQSSVADRLLDTDLLAKERIASLILVQDGQIYRKSTAVLKVVRELDGMWPVFSVFRVIPRPLRDALYDWFGRRRYRMFGKRDECWIPGNGSADRFIGL
jgi:predicted DCC family thiol-disulfide oxidoreductase YuxK